PDRISDRSDPAMAGWAHAAHPRLRHGAPEPLAIPEELRLFDWPYVMRQKRRLLRLDLRRGGPDRCRYLSRIVKRVVRCWGDKRRGRPVGAEMQKTRLGCHAPKKRHPAPRSPFWVREFLGQTWDRGRAP